MASQRGSCRLGKCMFHGAVSRPCRVTNETRKHRYELDEFKTLPAELPQDIFIVSLWTSGSLLSPSDINQSETHRLIKVGLSGGRSLPFLARAQRHFKYSGWTGE